MADETVGSWVFKQLHPEWQGAVPMLGSVGYYVDIGAYDGVTQDETRILDSLGWEGVCIEGNAEIYKRLKLARKRTYNAYVGGVNGESRTVLSMPLNNLGSAIKNNLPESHQKFLSDTGAKEIEIEIEHLEDILDKVGAPKHIELLKSDTEGACLEIMQSLSLERYTFDFIVLELGNPGHQNFFPKYPDGMFETGVKFLNSKDYELVHTLGQNNIFRKRGH